MTLAGAVVRVIAALSVGVLSAACVSTVDGTARRANLPQGAAPTLRSLGQVLPTEDEISVAAGNDLGQNGFPAQVGDIEVLPDGIRDNGDATPIDCVGATSPYLRVVYEKGDIRAAALADYWNYDADVAASSANVGAIQLASAADAQRLFASFIDQWRKCAGTTVTGYTHDDSNTELYSKITDVEVSGPILSATIIGWDNHHTPPYPSERAVGVASNVIVDVDVAVTGGVDGQRIAGTRAIDIAKLMLEKIANSS